MSKAKITATVETPTVAVRGRIEVARRPSVVLFDAHSIRLTTDEHGFLLYAGGLLRRIEPDVARTLATSILNWLNNAEGV